MLTATNGGISVLCSYSGRRTTRTKVRCGQALSSGMFIMKQTYLINLSKIGAEWEGINQFDVVCTVHHLAICI